MPSTLEKLRAEHGEAIHALAAKYHISNVRVFGSVARGEDDSNSDIDFLISLNNNNYCESLSFHVALEENLQRKVDVIVDDCLLPYVRPTIEREAVPL